MPRSRKLSKYSLPFYERVAAAHKALAAGEREVVMATGNLREVRELRFAFYGFFTALEAAGHELQAKASELSLRLRGPNGMTDGSRMAQLMSGEGWQLIATWQLLRAGAVDTSHEDLNEMAKASLARIEQLPPAEAPIDIDKMMEDRLRKSQGESE